MKLICVFAVLLSASALLAGPDWTEIPDAGRLLPGQTIPIPQPTSVLGVLVGMDAFGGPDIADLFFITTTAPMTTVRTGVGFLRGVTDFDTALFLFDVQGRGIVANDDTAPGDSSSTITILMPGQYFLGIAPKAVQPFSAAGNIFDVYAPGNQFEQVGPTTGGGSFTLAEWVGTPLSPEPRNYLAQFIVPGPGVGLVGVVGVMGMRRRR